MTAINHALTGAIIGLAVHNPVIAIPAALVSHVVCDAIPHFGSSDKNRIKTQGFVVYLVVDASLCGLLVLGLSVSGNPNWLLAAVCAFMAASPDFLWIKKFRAARENKKLRETKLEAFLRVIQWFERPIGSVVEVAWLVGGLVVLSAML